MDYLKIKSKSTKNERNLGIELLRMILCFWIVLFHCINIKNKYLINIIFKKRFHVPTFIFISFYFSYNNLYYRNIYKIKSKFERLLIPYIILPIIVWSINNLLYLIIKFNRFNRTLKFYDLIIQLIIGRKFIYVFWFQFELVFFNIFFYIISFLFKENFLFILQIIGIIYIAIQYNEVNYFFFIKYKTIISRTLGYFAETAPIAILSLSLASINFIQSLDSCRGKTIFFSFIFLYFLFNYNIFSEIKGFGYRGIIKIIGSMLLFIIFYLIPVDHIKFKKIIFFIKQISRYTQGIYWQHEIVKDYLEIKIVLIKNKTFTGCIIIYFISYLISFIGFKIFEKKKLKYLFI